MGAILEVKYFNSFLLKKINTTSNGPDRPDYNGSRGIPSDIGGYPVFTSLGTSKWAIEESRIRGGYNNTSEGYGVKAYIVEEENNGIIRSNSLIYSGIFNSRTGINKTNVFSVGEDITKSLDPAKGSIQKLYAEDTNLIIFQENKVNRALIDKDAIYSAEGGGTITSSNLVIGQIVPYAGEYGISTNPESFAAYGYRKYFADKRRNAILRLSRDGIEEISRYGMRDYFRDEFVRIDELSQGKIYGAFDIHAKQYVVSTQADLSLPNEPYNTLAFDEDVKGWTSFFSYKPQRMFSLRKSFYSISQRFDLNNGVLVGDTKANIFQHYQTLDTEQNSINRANFYGKDHQSSITFVFNPKVSMSKNFQTINYEGSNGWKVSLIQSDETGSDEINQSYSLFYDTGEEIKSYYNGEYVINPSNGNPVSRQDYYSVFGTYEPPLPRLHAGFNRKENKYAAPIISNSLAKPGEILSGRSVSGIKGYFATIKILTDTTITSDGRATAGTNIGGFKELFAVSSNYVESSY